MAEQLSIPQPIATLTGVVLAGGEARRMGGRDKGLIPFRGRPLAAYTLDALRQVAGRVLVNANRHREAYEQLGCPVIGDAGDGYQGPLAGMLAALRAAQTPHVLVVPCDCPLLQAAQLRRLYDMLLAEGAEICAAHDGMRINSVFAVLDGGLAGSLSAYMDSGERKAELWLKRHKLAVVDFSGEPNMFRNANTPEDLAALESLAAGKEG